MLTRYWIRFKPDCRYGPMGGVFGLGMGVTAYTLDDAKNLLLETAFPDGLPTIECVTENVKYDELDEGHVKPNMGIMVNRGIWFPTGFE